MHILQHHLAPGHDQRPGAGLFGDLGRLGQQIEHFRHIHQRLADLAVDRAQKVQRHGDLDHIGIDHHKIAHRQRAILHPHGRHHHHRNQPAGDKERLPKIQKCQRIGCQQRRALVALHGHVIAGRLALFGAEIFDRFKIQQAIDGLLVGIGVLVIHLAAQFYPPFRDLEGKPDIDGDGDNHHRQIARIEGEKENRGNKQQLKHQRPDAEQHEAQQEIHTLHTAFDNAR